jgi:hypothetical protein
MEIEDGTEWYSAVSTEDHGVFRADQLLNDPYTLPVLTVKERRYGFVDGLFSFHRDQRGNLLF